jgi:ubiquinone biosynthesis protein
VLAALPHIGRAIAIARTLARHDALFFLDRLPYGRALTPFARLATLRRRPADAAKRPGQRLVDALYDLGPSFIKLGQALSVRPDVVGEEMAADLSALQDRLPPFSGAEARNAIAAELGKPVGELFATFEDTAIAAASIAQVHEAVTADGREVVVKVLRPGIEAAFARDLAFLEWAAGIAERARPELRRLKPVETVRTFARAVDLEMDLRFEAAAGEELAQNFADDPTFRTPAMDWLRTGRRVLTMERVAGIPIDERGRLIEAGHDPAMVVATMARIFFLQVFRDGFFHADLHPGNLFVAADGAIVAVDFGIMGRLDRDTRRYLAEMLVGFLDGDYRRVAEVHFRAGYVPADQSVEEFAQAARSIAEPILGLPLAEISFARLLAQLFRVTERFRMETQPHLLLLQKTMLVAEGVGRRLYPDANMWQLARPLIEDWVTANLAPEARLGEAARDIAGALARLPRLVAEMEQTVGSLAQGGLRLHPDSVRALAAARAEARPRWPIWASLAAAAALVAAVVL